MKLLGASRWAGWRVLGLVLTVAIFYFLFRRIHPRELWAALRATNPWWFLLGLGVFAVTLLATGLRWHLTLHQVHRAVHAGATFRLVLIGHFFYVMLFGVAAGDLAKSAAYARWYGFHLPEVLAAAPLDRLMGLGAMFLWTAIIVASLLWGDALDRLGAFHWNVPGVWPVALVLILGLALLTLVLRPPGGEGPWARALRAFRSGGGRLLLKPRLLVGGILLGILGQLVLVSIIAINLKGVTRLDLPWQELAWVVAAVSIAGSLPFTFAGAGLRDLAAVALFGLYGVPAGECLAAGTLTLVQRLAWAGLGGWLLWRTERRFRSSPKREAARGISVVIAALNEAEALPETIRHARAVPEIREIIVVDGGSGDGTAELASGLGCRVLRTRASRGGQMRLGSAEAKEGVVLLLHADTWLPVDAGWAALNCLRDPAVVGGGYWKVFRKTPLLALGSRWKCAVRLVVCGRIVGDQGFFIRREVLEGIGGVPDMPLMEEFELSRRLRRVGKLALADAVVTTSARRFKDHGVLRTYLRMWRVTWSYYRGRPPADLVKVYNAGK